MSWVITSDHGRKQMWGVKHGMKNLTFTGQMGILSINKLNLECYRHLQCPCHDWLLMVHHNCLPWTLHPAPVLTNSQKPGSNSRQETPSLTLLRHFRSLPSVLKHNKTRYASIARDSKRAGRTLGNDLRFSQNCLMELIKIMSSIKVISILSRNRCKARSVS
jgi:hypothetical protein